MSALPTDAVIAACNQHSKPASFKPSYGTAGFRAAAHLLPSVMFRCGMLMAARSAQTGQATGLVVTASHNPPADNGIKLVDPTGHMLASAWEVHSDQLAGCDSSEEVESCLQDIMQREGVAAGHGGTVMLAHDTRPSAEQLTAAAAAGVECLGGTAQRCGLLTTPQLHWMVRQRNRGLAHSEADYHSTLGSAFLRLVKGGPGSGMAEQVVHVDCANGVGAAKLEQLQARLQGSGLQLQLHATGSGELNGGCGADFVQKERCRPAGFPEAVCSAGLQATTRAASIDGDADRLVYFAQDEKGFCLFDGDRIAVLAAMLVQQLVQELPAGLRSTSLGIVQTAYANGASTRYMTEHMGLPVTRTATGVKWLHKEATKFDIGIYWEANGHGTVLFQEPLLQQLELAKDSSDAAADLLALNQMVNQAIGDAFSGLLLVEAALVRLGWGLHQWAGLYEDMASRQIKVCVPDRTQMRTTDAETRIAAPEGLQSQIEAAVRQAPGAGGRRKAR